MCTHRYKGLLCLKQTPPADGDTCVVMLHKLGPVKVGSYQLGVSKVSARRRPVSRGGKRVAVTTDVFAQIFLKEELYQLLEGKRDRLLNVAAITLQRFTRMVFVRKNFMKFRQRVVGFESRCRGYLAR